MDVIVEKIIYLLKYNFIIRLVFAIPVIAKRKIKTLLYARSKQSNEILKMKNIYNGQRCFIIGSGNSLRVDDINKLSNEITFASNRIYRIYNCTEWRSDYYVSFEPEFSRIKCDYLKKIDVKKARFLNNIIYDSRGKDIYWLNCTSMYRLKKHSVKSIKFSDDISKVIYDGYTVTYAILQIAIYMGFKEIYLIGMDHNKDDDKTIHFYNDNINDFRTYTYWEGIEYAYRLAKEYCDLHGIKIYNATRGGKLEVFERVDFDSIVGKEKKYE